MPNTNLIKIEWLLNAEGKKVYPPTILQAIKDPHSKRGLIEILAGKASFPEEKAIAQALAQLNEKIKALEAIIAERVIERLDVAKEFNVWGKTNLILIGEGAPTISPDFVGQRYIDTANRIAYTAFNTDNAGGWKS